MLQALQIALVAGAMLVSGPAVRDDARHLATPRHGVQAMAGLGLAGAAPPVPDDLPSGLEGGWLFEGAAGPTDIYGSTAFNLPAAFGLWGLGRTAGAAGLAGLGRDLTHALAMAQVVVGPVKLAAHRRRPDGSNRLSFPSGHAANAVAIARVVQRRSGNRWGLPLYAVAALTAVGRLEDGRHYLSDVTAGATVGYIVGSAVGLGAGRRLSVQPALQGRGVRLVLAW